MPCSDCKFWNVNGDGPDLYDPTEDHMVTTPHRKCFAVIHGNNGSFDGRAITIPAMVRDGSGYAASLWTMRVPAAWMPSITSGPAIAALHDVRGEEVGEDP